MQRKKSFLLGFLTVPEIDYCEHFKQLHSYVEEAETLILENFKKSILSFDKGVINIKDIFDKKRAK